MTETKDLLISKKDNPKEFFLELRRIWREELQKEEKPLSVVAYNNGKFHGIWINARQDLDDIQEQVNTVPLQL